MDDGDGHVVPSTIKSVGTGRGEMQASRPVDRERIPKINESETVPPEAAVDVPHTAELCCPSRSTLGARQTITGR